MSFTTANTQRSVSPNNNGFKNVPMTRPPATPQTSGRENYVFTDSELKDTKLPFDYVATAVNFIIQNMHRPDASMEAYKQYAPAWFTAHRLNGHKITHAECNIAQDELLNFLRVKVNEAASRMAPIAAVGR